MAQRISIGFHASPPIALRVSDDALSALQAALGSQGWHDLHTEDGVVSLYLDKVSFLRIDSGEQRVGFSFD
jgi:hypothetical protein